MYPHYDQFLVVYTEVGDAIAWYPYKRLAESR